MEVIPVINCLDSKCIKERIALSETLGTKWIKFDISDGKFTPTKTWNKPAELKTDLNIEVHLMVEKPEDYVEEWLKAGAKRIIVHLEALQKTSGPNALESIIEKCSEHNADLMLAINPETPVEDLLPFLEFLFSVQFLAVKPGPSGQEFDERIIEKIKVLRERLPDVKIEIDGGINPETAKLVKEAGADIITSGSYIFNSKNPSKAYQDLVEVANLP